MPSSRNYAAFLDDVVSLPGISTPQTVLDTLHKASMRLAGISVLVACRLPCDNSELGKLKKGVNAFVHASAPRNWFPEYQQMAAVRSDVTLIFSELGLAPYTQSEIRRRLAPIGIDQWSFELAMKHGIRDAFLCPVGGRWLITFWSNKPLKEEFGPRNRAVLFLGATLAAIRLEELVSPEPSRLGRAVALTQRELAVLRHASYGERLRGISDSLALGVETVRSHLRRAQEKLGARTQAQTVAEAVRRRLIP